MKYRRRDHGGVYPFVSGTAGGDRVSGRLVRDCVAHNYNPIQLIFKGEGDYRGRGLLGAS